MHLPQNGTIGFDPQPYPEASDMLKLALGGLGPLAGGSERGPARLIQPIPTFSPFLLMPLSGGPIGRVANSSGA